MVFSSPIFLFVFLPLTLLCYYGLPSLRAKNALLLAASLLFYAVGELRYLPLLLLSVGISYLSGIFAGGRYARAALVCGLVLHLLLLGYYKYLGFFAQTANGLFSLSLPVPEIALPLGISFFTFQGISYMVDVYREPARRTKSYSAVLLYISLFPQLIAGPIVKYESVQAQFARRTHDAKTVAGGIRRFVVGLSKKLLLADGVGAVSDAIFGLSAAALSPAAAWLGTICYMLQVYYDFSGYSDMALGMGQMFGLRFAENFRYPFAADSVREFWRRWHISLSSFFRDYVYLPLGGSRVSPLRKMANTILIFVLTGLWHGAAWTFVLWGLWHGVLLILEQLVPPLPKKVAWIQRIIVSFLVILSFVPFRANTVAQAGGFFAAMLGLSQGAETTAILLQNLWMPKLWLTLLVAVLGSVPLWRWLVKRLPIRTQGILQGASLPLSLALLALCVLQMAANDFSPFLYFRF